MTGTQLQNDIMHTRMALSGKEADKLKNTVILLTGAYGFLGYYFLHFFRQAGKDLGIKKLLPLIISCLENPHG